jgi:hypothetical protein
MGHTLRLAVTVLAVALVAASPAYGAPAKPVGLGVADLVAAPEVFDPQFMWGPVSGAKGYEVEINSSSSWASGSRVCCDDISFMEQMTTYGTSYSPPLVLFNNAYYWRVRAIDASGNAGAWAAGPSFTKAFANSPSGDVQNLRLVDSNLDVLAPGSPTDTPIVLWDAVPGASSYQVIVAPFSTSGGCDWSAPGGARWDRDTATTGWTPLGWFRGINADPLSSDKPPSDDLITGLISGQDYCVRVRPIDRSSKQSGGPVIWGDWTYLPNNNVPAFTWSGPPPAVPCSPCSMAAGDYITPVSDSTVGRMPVFTWHPIPGAQSYFIVVARDPSFTTVVDYAWTRVPAYAPRTVSLTKGYADETTDYYWAVLPAQQDDGHGVSAELTTSNPQPFTKQATPPNLIGPASGTVISKAATVFRWSPVFGARRYRVQVSDDPTFVNVISEGGAQFNGAVTDSTAYTSNTAYPTGRTLYWRVQAEAEDGANFVGLTWSASGTFSRAGSSGSNTRFRLSAVGNPVRRKFRTITITVKNRATLAPVAAARVRVSGAGVSVRTKTTGATGKASFRLRARRYPGRVTFRVSKSGFTTAYLYRSVRRA